jgi:hypothetical protein
MGTPGRLTPYVLPGACALPKEKNMWRKIVIALMLGIIFLPRPRSGNGVRADDMGDEETPGNQASNNLVYQPEEEKIRDLLHTRDERATKRNRSVLFVKKVNFGLTDGDNWLVEWSNPETQSHTNLNIYLIDDYSIKKVYYLGNNDNKYGKSVKSQFDIMKDMPGTHIGNGTSSIDDFNGDGLDEVFQYGFGGNGKFIFIIGYDNTEDNIGYYCNIPFGIIDPENGPAPVEFMTYKGMNGFKVYYVANNVAGGIGCVPKPMPDNRKWFFYTWDETTRKYIRVEEVVDEPLAVTEPIETTVVPLNVEPETIEDNTPAIGATAVAPTNLVFFIAIVVALLVGGILLVILVLRKKRRKNA